MYICIYVCVCMYVCMYIYIYIHNMYVYAYMYVVSVCIVWEDVYCSVCLLGLSVRRNVASLEASLAFADGIDNPRPQPEKHSKLVSLMTFS